MLLVFPDYLAGIDRFGHEVLSVLQQDPASL